jgi:acyl-coenzyme A thioesterase 9
MHDSYSQTFLPFASDPQLFEQYISPLGTIRLGKLFEHLDSLAGSIAYKHMLGPSVSTLDEIEERGFYIVTAAVDRLDLLQSELFISGEAPAKDLLLSGHVVFTGFSSMEVVVKMESVEDGMTLMLGQYAVFNHPNRRMLSYLF